MLAFTRRLIAPRSAHPVFRRRVSSRAGRSLNGAAERVAFVLPDERWAPAYDLELDTADDARDAAGFKAGSTVEVEGRSVVLLRTAG